MEDYTKMVEGLRKVFLTGRTLEVSWRRRQLEQLLKMVEQEETRFVEALKKDLNKAAMEAKGMEINFARNEIISHLNMLDEWAGPQYVKKDMTTMMDTCYIKPEPLGVCLIIGAWNYPLQLTIHPLIGAISAGNCVVIKPSELSEHTANLVAELIPKYLDPECFTVVLGAVPETTALLKERFDHILYTGNSAVAKIVMAAAAKHLTPVTLELGGKSPCYIHESSDVDIAANRILWGKFTNCGQTCVAPDYILCNQEVEDKLLRRLKVALKEFYGEDPQNSPDFGRIVNKRHFQRIKALYEGADVAIGGKSDESENYIEPTVLINVKPDDKVMQSEVFGPVLPIVRVNSPDEAIAFIKSREKPLALYAFSKDESVTEKVTKLTSSGGLLINDTLVYAVLDTLPFGGVGHSGCGAYHGKFSFDTFSHHRAVMIKKQSMEVVNGIRYPPYTEKKMYWLDRIMKKSPKSTGVMKYVLLVFGVFMAFIFKTLGLFGMIKQ